MNRIERLQELKTILETSLPFKNVKEDDFYGIMQVFQERIDAELAQPTDEEILDAIAMQEVLRESEIVSYVENDEKYLYMEKENRNPFYQKVIANFDLSIAALRAYRKTSIPIQQIINGLQLILDERLEVSREDIKQLILQLETCVLKRKPTAEEAQSIDRAISTIEDSVNDIKSYYSAENGHPTYADGDLEKVQSFELAITALRRMKGE